MDFQRTESFGSINIDDANVETGCDVSLSQLPTSVELLETGSDCIILIDPDWRITYVNARATAEFACENHLIGSVLWEAFPVATGTIFETNYREVMKKRTSMSFVAFFAPLSGWYEVLVHPLSSGGIGVWFRNITDSKERDAQISSLFSQALVGVMQCGTDGRVQSINNRYCRILGRSRKELSDLTVADYTHPDDLEWNLPLLEGHRKTGEPFQIEKRYLRPDGSVVWCRVYVSFVSGRVKDTKTTIVIAEDITEQKEAELELRRGEQLYRSVLEASADCIKILDLDGNLEVMNAPGMCTMELDNFEKVRGRAWRNFWPEDSVELVDNAVAEAREGKVARFTAFCPTAAGSPKWWDVVVSPMCDDEGRVTRILAISRDITLQRASAERLKWTSDHDALTELPNRRAFEAHLQAATIRAMQRDRQVGLLLLDLDHFKHVNDTLGHPAGDHLLTVFARRLKECLRENDFVARLGGDEFAIVFEGRGKNLDLLSTGASILARLQEPIRFEGRVITASASMGGALFPADASNANELFKNADIALYSLKASGRGGTRMFHQHMREQTQLVSSQLSLARSAITTKSVEPHYQQKIDLGTGDIAGFEALLRWRHSRRGIQHPDTVSEAFKDFELATKIGELMQRRVFADMRQWLNRGLPFGIVAINAAPVEFLRDDFAESFLARIDQAHIPARLLELEITEHVFLERGTDYVGRALKLLSERGVRIALDDFGTGYSSLSHLRDFPVDVVKIDRSFVERMETDAEIKAIVCAVIDLAESLKIEVVAEGVETDSQRQLLVANGCRVAQGYLFGRAVEADEVPLLLTNRRQLKCA